RATGHLQVVGHFRLRRAARVGQRAMAAARGRRLHRRRPRAELHVYRAAAAVDGVRRRPPPGEPQPAPSLYGALPGHPPPREPTPCSFLKGPFPLSPPPPPLSPRSPSRPWARGAPGPAP